LTVGTDEDYSRDPCNVLNKIYKCRSFLLQSVSLVICLCWWTFSHPGYHQLSRHDLSDIFIIEISQVMQFLLKLTLISTGHLSCLGPLENYELFGSSIFPTVSVPGEGYSRKAYTKVDMYVFITINVSIPLLMDFYFSSRGYHPHSSL
jgi:hypothetical protein